VSDRLHRHAGLRGEAATSTAAGAVDGFPTVGVVAGGSYGDLMTAPQLACPLCRCTQFQREEGRLESRWGMTRHRMVLLICQQCRYVLHFYDRHSVFDLG
jgi:predicted nucleic-acid-binding Zn-ribbon protein